MRRLASYYLLMALAGALGVAKGVILARVLGMEGFGNYGLAVVLGAAFQFVIGLGSVEGLGVALPQHFGAQRLHAAHACVSAATRMIVLRAGAVTLISAGILIPLGHYSLAMAALLGLSNALTTIPMVVARSQGNLLGFGLRMFLKGGATLSLAIAGAFSHGADGAVLGEFIGSMVALVLACGWKPRGDRVPWRSSPKLDAQLRAEGWPLLMQGVNVVAQQNIERWTVAATLGLDGVGKYGLAQLFITAVNLVHATFFQQAGARVLTHMAAGQPARQVMAKLAHFAGGLGVATAALLFVLGFYVNEAVSLVAPGLGSFTWGFAWLGGAALAQMLHQFDWVLIGTKDQALIERIAWAGTALTLALCMAGFAFGLPLEYFLFAYFIGRLFIMTTTFTAAWLRASSRQTI